MSVISQISDQASSPNHRSETLGSNWIRLMWRRRWLIWAAINPPEKEKEGKINQSINAVDPREKTTHMLSIEKKRKKETI